MWWAMTSKEQVARAFAFWKQVIQDIQDYNSIWMKQEPIIAKLS